MTLETRVLSLEEKEIYQIPWGKQVITWGYRTITRKSIGSRRDRRKQRFQEKKSGGIHSEGSLRAYHFASRKIFDTLKDFLRYWLSSFGSLSRACLVNRIFHKKGYYCHAHDEMGLQKDNKEIYYKKMQGVTSCWKSEHRISGYQPDIRYIINGHQEKIHQFQLNIWQISAEY